MTDGLPASPGDGAGEASTSGQIPVDLLLETLEQEYLLLAQRLSKHLGSREAAEEALHDTYLKLKAGPNIVNLRAPLPYLYRMTINLALNQRRNQGRMQTLGDTDISNFPDDDPGPERFALATDEMERALTALHKLPSRRRDIFLARWRDDKSQAEIAAEFAMHKRSVQKELSKAERYLRKILGRTGRRSP